jgi:Domain of unknown function (DUF1788)
MDRVDGLIGAYREHVERPWRRDLSGPERVWIAVYPPEIERRLRVRFAEFELATKDAGHLWRHLDVTRSFSDWLASQEYREAFFENPDDLKTALPGFAADIERHLREALRSGDDPERTVVALSGIGALYPMAHVSTLIQRVATDVRGRLLVFFPGTLEHGNYRLLDARDGWNYLAIPITIPEGTR